MLLLLVYAWNTSKMKKKQGCCATGFPESHTWTANTRLNTSRAGFTWFAKTIASWNWGIKGKYTLELNEQTLVTVSETADLKDLRQQDKRFDSMRTALENLQCRAKALCNFVYLEKKSYQQISNLQGFNIIRVKSYIQNGEEKPTKILMERFKDEWWIEKHITPSREITGKEKLLQYLHNNMQEDELHEFESAMNDDEFMNDAVEAYRRWKIKQHPALVQQLNSDLKKQLERRRKKEKEKYSSPGFTWQAYYWSCCWPLSLMWSSETELINQIPGLLQYHYLHAGTYCDIDFLNSIKTAWINRRF